MDTMEANAVFQLSLRYPASIIIEPFMPAITVPIGKSRLRVKMDPTMSSPPVEPPTRKETPVPIPISTPPNTELSKGSVATAKTGRSAMNQEVAATERILNVMKRRPRINQPAMSRGMLRTKYIILRFKLVK
ncbi:hypothetical protein D3C74_374960 [compost metagenome]